MSGTELADRPISDPSQDKFGFLRCVEVDADLLYNIAQNAGATLAVMGPWGSGKSSYMRLIEHKLKQDHPDVIPVWFSVWQYEEADLSMEALLYVIIAEAKKLNLESNIGNRIIKADRIEQKLAEALGKRKGWRDHFKTALEGAKIVGAASIPYAEAAAKAGELILDATRPSIEIKAQFDDLSELLENTRRTVFLFLDDLDRTDAAQIRTILQTLKIYLDQKRIAVVLGYEQEYVEKSLARVLTEGISPRRYLEKIVTVERPIPVASFYEFSMFVTEMLDAMLGEAFNEEWKEHLARQLTYLLQGIPRMIKRATISSIQIIKSSKIGTGTRTDFAIAAVAILAALGNVHPPVLEKISNMITRLVAHPDPASEIKTVVGKVLEETKSMLPNLDERTRDILDRIINHFEQYLGNDQFNYAMLSVVSGIKPFIKDQAEIIDEEFIGSTLEETFISLIKAAFKRGITLRGALLGSNADVKIPQGDFLKNDDTAELLKEYPSIEGSFVIETNNAVWIIIHSVNRPHTKEQLLTLIPKMTAKKDLCLWFLATNEYLASINLQLLKDLEKLKRGYARNLELYFTSDDHVQKLTEQLLEILVGQDSKTD